MNNSVLRYVFDRLKQSSNSVNALLQIEVREIGSNRKVLLSTGQYLFKEQFSPKNGFTCVKHDKAAMVTGKARKMYNEVEAFVNSGKCSELTDIRNWDKVDKHSYSVVAFMESELKKRNPTKATMEHHLALIRKVEVFGKIKTFDDITYSNIADLDLYLRESVHSQPVLYKRHATFRGYIQSAVARGLCSRNPYGSGQEMFEVKKGKGKEPVFLLENEVAKIQAYKPETDSLQKVKDLFLFQCFSGVAYTDLMGFDITQIYEMEGFKVYRSSRNKTDESFISVLLPEAEQILAKYDGALPKLSNQNYNAYLKILIAGAGVNKVVSTHTGRHTFATYLLNRNVPMESVSRAMGHADIRQTTHYARMLGKKVISDMRALIDANKPPTAPPTA